ncbi:MAG: helix-turn-helix domain-containing protein [Lachnospiraceae bacterium]
MTTQESMGLKIKSLREQKKMSQSTLAELVGYKDKTAIAKVEAGKVDLPQSKISAFAKALNTTTSYLFADDSNDVNSPKTLAAHFDGNEYTEDELEEIKQFAEFVKNKRK